MTREAEYLKTISGEHMKKFGQYFTSSAIADFMCSWVCPGAKTMLDPAVGNSIFFLHTQKYNPACLLTGYELDCAILDFFGDPAGADILHADYLLNGWDEKYDAIVCNPPYHRFQDIPNRREIIASIHAHTGLKCSCYTNLYLLFLFKSIFQLSDTGRLAYLIPSEFLNSQYGTQMKQLLLDRRLLRAVIDFKNDKDIFSGAVTTSCILLLDQQEKACVSFYSLSSMEELEQLKTGDGKVPSTRVPYKELNAEEKWRRYLKQENSRSSVGLVEVSRICSVSRGIATGDNDYFCFSLSKAARSGVPVQCLSRCICRSADVQTAVFTGADFRKLSDCDKTVYLLDAVESDAPLMEEYIRSGEQNGIHKKHLPSRRKPWFSMERRQTAPIWVSSASRSGMKFVRNLAGVKTLTTFHSVFIREGYKEDTDLIFCYFLTPTAQAILRENRKELGGGLDKFQPGDLMTAKMLDTRAVSPEDRQKVFRIYRELGHNPSDAQLKELDRIFAAYLPF